MINIEQLNNQEYSVLQDGQEIGIIQTYSNPLHNQNCYLQLNLQSYDLQITDELFRELARKNQRPLQIMLSSNERKKIAFVEKGGFECKRKCYEINVEKEDYLGKSMNDAKVFVCKKGSLEYEQACELLHDYYSKTHENINPLTADIDVFSQKLPTQVFYEKKDDELINVAFVEENEIAYVCTKDREGFTIFARNVVENLFIENESLFFECDDCDWAAMELCSLFDIKVDESYNTYIRDIKLLDIQPSQFYLSQEKIDRIKEWFDPDDLSDFEPIPIKYLNGKIIFTDGHTRAWVAYEAGLTEVPFVWDEDDLDWELYQQCVDACLERGVHTVADLGDRVLSSEDYVIKWDYWCDELQEKHAYLKNPCGTCSIPYWKSKVIQVPENMKILHGNAFDKKLLYDYVDEKYFRLSHNLEQIENISLDDFYVKTATKDEIPLLVDLINQSYTDLSITYEQLFDYTKSRVFDEELWTIVYEKDMLKPVGCGIAEFDKELKEGILEWIQVLPQYRGKKIGQLLVNELLTRLQGKADFVTVSGKVDNDTKPELLYRKCGFTGNDVWHVLIKK